MGPRWPLRSPPASSGPDRMGVVSTPFAILALMCELLIGEVPLRTSVDSGSTP